jgi:hypothetical protein
VPNCDPVPPPTGFVITPREKQPQRSVQDDAEYRRNYTAAEYINALYALDNGWDGSGVLVGVIDDGVREIPELEGKISELSKDFGGVVTNGVRTDREGGPNAGDENSTHGTPVGAIIAAKNDGVGVQGLAPGTTIVSLRVDSLIDDKKVFGTGMWDAIRYAIDNDIKILNASLAYPDADTVSKGMQETLQRYRDFGGLWVNSAGNSSGPNPQSMHDMTDDNAEGILFVVAISPTGKDYEITGYSNACGEAKDRCVAAVGGNLTHDVNGELIGYGGTSSAAPQVSALAAMILSKWRQLSGVDAGNLILSTSRDIGASGVDEIYGNGLIDVKAALSPVNPTLSNGLVTSSIGNSVMVMGGAFGYGPASFEGAYNDITVLDEFGRDFSGDISGLVVRPASSDGHWLRRRVEAQANAGNTGIVTSQMSGVIGYTALGTGLRDAQGTEILENRLTNAQFALKMANGTNFTAGFNSSDNVMDDMLGLAPTSDAMFAYTPLAQTSFGVSQPLGEGRLGVSGYAGSQEGISVNGAVVQWASEAASIKVGLVDETGTVFGTPVGAGAMRFGDGAKTVFFEASSGITSGPWTLEGYASLGATRLKLANDMLLTDAETITSGRFGITVSRDLHGGQVSFGVAQRLVALSGVGIVTTANGYDLPSRRLTFEERKVDMSGQFGPQLTIGYERTRERSSVRFGASSDSEARDVRAVGTMVLRFN